MADRSDYPGFVAGCWTRLLRTAYLLMQDWAAAEDLTQAALVKAWLAWPRLDDDPEAYVVVVVHLSLPPPLHEAIHTPIPTCYTRTMKPGISCFPLKRCN